MIVCLAGLANDHTIIVVSNDPLATNREFGDQATQFTFALWKPHSCLWAGCGNGLEFFLFFFFLTIFCYDGEMKF